MELKLRNSLNYSIDMKSSNCTFMELKLEDGVQSEESTEF